MRYRLSEGAAHAPVRGPLRALEQADAADGRSRGQARVTPAADPQPVMPAKRISFLSMLMI